MDLLIQEHLRGLGHEPKLPAPWLDPSCNRQPNSQQQRHRNHAPYREEFALRIAAKENQDTDHFLRTDLSWELQSFEPSNCLERLKRRNLWYDLNDVRPVPHAFNSSLNFNIPLCGALKNLPAAKVAYCKVRSVLDTDCPTCLAKGSRLYDRQCHRAPSL